MKILIQFPTRGRHDQFLEYLKQYFSLLSGKHDVRVQIITDFDDAQMANDHTEDFIRATTGGKYWLRRGSHAGKIAAMNSDMGSAINSWAWDVCMLVADDMWPKAQNYDDIIAQMMRLQFPDFDGVLWFNDGHLGDKLNVLPILGREYFKRFGSIYHPGYQGFYCDNEFTDVATMLNRQVYFEQVLIDHRHPHNVGGKYDLTYKANDKFWEADKALYEERKARRFDLQLLDVFICTMPSRKKMLDKLQARLEGQMAEINAQANVNVIILEDDGTRTIGEKRNMLLDSAQSEYVCSLDDDDNIASDYLAQILQAIGPCDIDCVGLIGMMMHGPGDWRRFEHFIAYTDNGQRDGGVYIRPPNHLNPIRRKIAQRYRFKELNHGEDSDWSLRICGDKALKTERQVTVPIYYYIPSQVYKREHATAWDREVLDRMAVDRIPGATPSLVAKRVPPNDERTPGTLPGPVGLQATASEHIPGKFPEPTRPSTGGWRWEGPEWMRKKKMQQLQKQGG